MRKRPRLLRAASLILALMLVVFSIPSTVAAETPAEKYARLKEELAATRQQISELKDDVAAAKAYKAALEAQKVILDEIIDLNLSQIAATELQLEQKQAEVAAKRQVIYENDQLLQQRMVAIYNMNNTSLLSQLFTVDNLSEFTMLTDSMRRVSQHDIELLELLKSEREALEAEQAEIDQLLDELNEHYTELTNNREELVAALMEADASLTEAQARLAAEQKVEGDQAEALAQAQQEMQAIANSVKNSGSSSSDGSEYIGGRLGWPVPGYYEVSCEFGSPDPNGQGHRGMDIRAAAGTPIVASNDGTVILATYAHSSYGNYLVIDHGGGVKTLYAHCTELWVSVGQAVTKGQSIASVGSTGFSTGNHLHLEVINNGVLENPRNWLQA